MPGLLRICTAGSVDDGKSTLIGRLLYDSQAVYEDQVKSVQAATRNKTAGPIDFSLFTDGLRAEREQGITIDVAYRYFATARRKFILADTPGHEQYTRNMATGASTADVAILLVDARHGVKEQTRRHARIAHLLGISSFILAVNKMDLIDFDRGVFEAICDDFAGLAGEATVTPIPMSALHGDNVTVPSERTPWFTGQSLLEHLETVDVERQHAAAPFRMPVQLVLRPDQEFRGYAGQIASGTIRPGDKITVWPSGWTSTVARIVTWDGDLDVAQAPMSVTLVLEDELDISRGDVLAVGPIQLHRRVSANVVWMDERPLDPGRVYLLKHNTRVATAEVDRGLALNEIGTLDRDRVAAARLRSLHRQPHDRQLRADRPGDELHGRGGDDPAPSAIARRGRRRRRRDGGRAAGARGARGGHRCRRRGSCSPPARGGAHMSDALKLVADELAGAKAPCVTSSFQAECVVLVHMLREVAPDIPVLFLDTVHHFPQTIAYRDELASRWGLNLVTLRAAEPAPGLWQQDTKACCGKHKVEPLFGALANYDVWFTGLRRAQSASRAALEEVEPFKLPGGQVLRKVSPLASWSTKEVWAYAKAHDIPLLPLYDLGYTSVGCEPCTTLPVDPGNDRSGRWQGQKLECGIHIQADR